MSEQWHKREPNPSNPVVFFDVAIAGEAVGRLKMELFEDICPKTTENFKQFCTGEYKIPAAPIAKLCCGGVDQSATYKGSSFHRIIPGFMVQGGDFINGNGTGAMNIYGGGRYFPDENFVATHSGPGILAMANSGPNTNGCQFYITLKETNGLNGVHVVFGRVLEDGMDIVKKLEAVETWEGNNKPKVPCVITDSGVL